MSLTRETGEADTTDETWFATGKAGNRKGQCSSWNDWVRGGGKRKGQTEPGGWGSRRQKELVIKGIIRAA